jgi:hypothetical protein
LWFVEKSPDHGLFVEKAQVTVYLLKKAQVTDYLLKKAQVTDYLLKKAQVTARRTRVLNCTWTVHTSSCLSATIVSPKRNSLNNSKLNPNLRPNSWT